MELIELMVAAPVEEIDRLIPTTIKECAKPLGITPAEHTAGHYLALCARDRTRARRRWAQCMLV